MKTLTKESLNLPLRIGSNCCILAPNSKETLGFLLKSAYFDFAIGESFDDPCCNFDAEPRPRWTVNIMPTKALSGSRKKFVRPSKGTAHTAG
jgi:hypothetical protein